jgi:hypothetical protein
MWLISILGYGISSQEDLNFQWNNCCRFSGKILSFLYLTKVCTDNCFSHSLLYIIPLEKPYTLRYYWICMLYLCRSTVKFVVHNRTFYFAEWVCDRDDKTWEFNGGTVTYREASQQWKWVKWNPFFNIKLLWCFPCHLTCSDFCCSVLY